MRIIVQRYKLSSFVGAIVFLERCLFTRQWTVYKVNC